MNKEIENSKIEEFFKQILQFFEGSITLLEEIQLILKKEKDASRFLESSTPPAYLFKVVLEEFDSSQKSKIFFETYWEIGLGLPNQHSDIDYL